MKKFVAAALTAVLAVSTVAGLASCGGEKEDEFKFGLICLHDDSSTYDKNFIDAAKAAVKKAGLKESQFVVETNIAEDANCKETAEDLVDGGCDLIFADSFGHGAHVLEVAKKNPNVEFCHATGTDAHTAGVANFHNAFASIYEGRYLTGVVAGMKLEEMIKEGKIKEDEAKIGYVGAYPYAEVISGYTSFYLGAKSVCPTVTMDVQFTGSWYNVTNEKTTATNLINNGCKLISQHADSMGAPNACEETKKESLVIPNISYNVSTNDSCPETYLVASRINWEPYFTYIINQAKGKFEAKKANADADVSEFKIDTDWVGTVKTGSVELFGLGKNVAKGTAEKLEEVKAQLADGSLKVFDVTKFKVDKAKNPNAEVDDNGHLTSYKADVDSDAKFTPDTEVVKDGIFMESHFRSAPYFDLQIEGITKVNAENK